MLEVAGDHRRRDIVRDDDDEEVEEACHRQQQSSTGRFRTPGCEVAKCQYTTAPHADESTTGIKTEPGDTNTTTITLLHPTPT